MKNKIIAGVSIQIGLVFFYLAYRQYLYIQLVKGFYQSTADSLPLIFSSSVPILSFLGFMAIVFSISFLLKK